MGERCRIPKSGTFRMKTSTIKHLSGFCQHPAEWLISIQHWLCLQRYSFQTFFHISLRILPKRPPHFFQSQKRPLHQTKKCRLAVTWACQKDAVSFTDPLALGHAARELGNKCLIVAIVVVCTPDSNTTGNGAFAGDQQTGRCQSSLARRGR